MAKIEEKVESLVKDKIEKIGYELYDVLYVKEGSNKILRIVIDNENGISLDDCEKVNNEIKEIIDRGIEFLADAQDEEGGYLAYGDKSSESVSQVIITLSTYGIDCNKDQRFLKNGKGLYDTLMEYYQKDGSFSHLLEADADPMATDQAFCALVAYQRFQQGKSSFYNMSE